MPWRRPRDMPTLSTIRLSGPGDSVINSAALRKPMNCSGEISKIVPYAQSRHDNRLGVFCINR
jgi:hypothetical protein